MRNVITCTFLASVVLSMAQPALAEETTVYQTGVIMCRHRVEPATGLPEMAGSMGSGHVRPNCDSAGAYDYYYDTYCQVPESTDSFDLVELLYLDESSDYVSVTLFRCFLDERACSALESASSTSTSGVRRTLTLDDFGDQDPSGFDSYYYVVRVRFYDPDCTSASPSRAYTVRLADSGT